MPDIRRLRRIHGVFDGYPACRIYDVYAGYTVFLTDIRHAGYTTFTQDTRSIMSHTSPEQVFGYNTSNVNYCYDEPDSYVPDYADTEAISERSHVMAPSNVTTELYRRKACVASSIPPEAYRHNMYIAPNYYYDPFPHRMPTPVRRTVIYRRSYPMVDENAQYYATPIDDSFRNHEVYSTPQMRTVRRQPTAQHTIHQTTPRLPRRHHVAVRTPRYYRRTMTNATKKPSALCLPVTCQPDPAGYRRNRKHPEERAYSSHPVPKELSRSHSVPMQFPLLNDQEQKDMHMTQSDVDAVLARYDTIFEGPGLETPTDKCESVSSKNSSKVKMLPKVPPSIKKQQEKIKKYSKKGNAGKCLGKKNKSFKHTENIHVEEITTDVLDSMLTELMNSENKQNEINQNKDRVCQTIYEIKESEDVNKNNTSSQINTDPRNQYFNSFNYQDISSNMSKSQIPNFNKFSNDNRPCAASVSSCLRNETQNISVKQSLHNKSKQSVCDSQSDDNGVMELHRSKSYIVNLIDRALSKELGTIPDEIYFPKELNSINTKQAACTMRKHDKGCENNLGLEISQALGDSLLPNNENDTKHDCTCACNVQDEPLYIKQLRQLRWGHLKHIQTEVRRLEDLERFLDSCTNPSSR
ncbi:hypothetical protein FQR65_LT13033 [Abscondita terminalis]|nr:hypothetical protein FQR65_LT13033 [Abscondita terminalis]